MKRGQELVSFLTRTLRGSPTIGSSPVEEEKRKANDGDHPQVVHKRKKRRRSNERKVAARQLLYLKRNLSRTAMRGQPEVTFRIRVMDSDLGNDNEKIFFQARSDSKCPFCNYKSQSNKASIKHCFRFHLDHHKFSIEKRRNDSILVDAKPLKSAENSKAVRNTRDESFQFVRFRRKFRGRQEREPPILSNDKKEFFVNYSETKRPGEIQNPPIRQYYHSQSRLPMKPGEWDVDSDNELDGWMNEYGKARLHDLTDVSENEKKFLDLWNSFMRRRGCYGDKETAQLCILFIQENNLKLKGLRRELLAHLITLWEHCRVGRSDMLRCIKEYDDLQKVL